MNVTKGPMLERYATLIDEQIEVVLEWVNNYVNKPGLLPIQEATEKERLASIKAYITRQIETSTTERIRNDIKAKRLKAAA
jgi:hypothetical protein